MKGVTLKQFFLRPISTYTGADIDSFFIKSSLSVDGNYLASGSSDNNVYIWNTRDNVMIYACAYLVLLNPTLDPTFPARSHICNMDFLFFSCIKCVQRIMSWRFPGLIYMFICEIWNMNVILLIFQT